MKNLLYIGNKLSTKGKTVTSIETLGRFLEAEGFIVKTASSKTNKFFRLVDMLHHVIKYRKETNYVLIDTYSTSNFYYALLVSQLCRFFKLKYIPILRGGNLPKRLKSNPNLSKAIFNNALINVAPSEYVKSSFESFNYTNLVCIPNTIELDNYPFKIRELDTVKLLWVRSFSEIYNPLLAIKLLKILKNEKLDASLCMVGPDNDGYLEKAKSLANDLKVDVSFTGKLSKEAWIKHSENFNIFINTTNFDNMPVSVIEAMALGIPIISTNVGGIPFLIEHKIDGVLVNPNSIDEFLNAIKELLQEPKMVVEMTTNARKKVEQFDWKYVKNKWHTVLQ